MPNPRWIIALLALAALPALAESPGPLRMAALSARLYDAGIAAGDPIMVATAAQLRRTSGIAAGAGPDWLAMMGTAEALAAGDAEVLGVISDLRADAARGVASGPITHLATLEAGASETRPPMPFRAGEYAEAYVEAPLGVDLNLTVMDAAGNVVCSDLNPSHIAYCGWTPASDGAFTLIISNAGALAGDYALMTN